MQGMQREGKRFTPNGLLTQSPFGLEEQLLIIPSEINPSARIGLTQGQKYFDQAGI